MKRILTIILLFNLQILFAQSGEFKKMLAKNIAQTVPIITVDSLKNNLDSFIILDAREEQEYNVSHLNKAVFVGYEKFNLVKTIKQISTGKPIVVYCSIGYRSEKIAEKLQKKGFKVYNLYGGIFHWKDEGNPVFNTSSKRTEQVHAYDKDWGKWLLNAEKAYE